jgi:hypothetical protein
MKYIPPYVLSILGILLIIVNLVIYNVADFSTFPEFDWNKRDIIRFMGFYIGLSTFLLIGIALIYISLKINKKKNVKS